MFQTYLDAIRVSKTSTLVVALLVVVSGCSQRQTDITSLSSPDGKSSLGVITKELLDANALLKADPNNETKLAQLKDKAQKRLSALLEALEKDPSSVLDVAFSKKVRDSFPDSAKEYLEEELHQIRGTLGVLCAMQEEGLHQDHYVLTEADGKRFSLHLKQGTHHGHQSGTDVEIPSAISLPDSAGMNHLITADMSGTGSGSSEMIEAYVPPNPTTGVFKTLMILANFRDQAQPWTPDGIRGLGQSVNDFNYENSFRHTTLPTTVVGPFTIPADSTTTTCDLSTITSKINPLLSAAGIDTSGYDRRVYITPKLSTCGGTVGWGYIGGGKAWGITWVGAATLQVTGHELGHNFGLHHAGSRNCGATTIGSSCTSSAYADVIDTMGNRRPAHFNAAQKESLGWLNQSGFPSITAVQSSGTYAIEPYESYSMNPKAIRLAKSPDALGSKYYYLEYRQPIGFDNIGFPGNLYQGLTLHQGSGDVSSNYTYLLNMTPTDTSWNNAAISGTNVFNDPDAPGGGVSISLSSASSSGASVSVKFGSSPAPTCTRANPSWSVSPNTVQWVSPGAGASYTLTLKSNDSSACSISSYQLTATPVAGVTANLSGSSLSLAPGASGNITLQIQSALTTGSGTYTVPVKAANLNALTFAASVSASLGVQSPCVRATPSITLSPASQTVAKGSSATFGVSIKNMDSATCPANVFGFQANAGSGITTFMEPYNVVVAPGQTATSALKVTIPATMLSATYPISVSGSERDVNLPGVGTGSVIVPSPPPSPSPTPTLTPSPRPSPSPANLPPVARISATQSPSGTGISVAFNGSGSSDPDGLVASYSWNFGDGSPIASGAQVSHLYSIGGTYTARLTVTDNKGATASASYSVVVSVRDIQPPTAPSSASATLRTSGSKRWKRTSTYVQVAWAASTDNVGVAKYVISRNGAVLASVTTLSYSDKTTVKGGTYTYRVVAYDAAGNASPASNSASVTR